MSQDHQSFLRFSLEESVWFQKGQEVAELISISLDPNITIIENDQYVTIRGSLELTGEYKRNEEDGTAVNTEVVTASRFVQSIEEREEGVCEFLHRFPVDITIPNNRIQSVYDINVTVDSFDYVVPERSCLKLSAELTISGLYGEQQNVPVEEEERDNEFSFSDSEEPGYTENEEQNPDYQPLYRTIHEDDPDKSNNYNPNFILSYPVESASNELEDESGSDDISKPFSAEAKKQPNSPAENPWGAPLQNEPPPPKVPEFTFAAKRSEGQGPKPEDQFVEEPAGFDQPQPEGQNNGVAEEVQDYKGAAETDASESEDSSILSEQTPQKSKKGSKKKSMSIAEFLARKAETEQQAKLKICIVQHGDTLDSLSERYQIPVHQLLRVNHLEATQDVYDGQVLYIPEPSSSNR